MQYNASSCCQLVAAVNRQISTVGSSQVVNQEQNFQQKPLHNVSARTLASNCLRNTRRNVHTSNSELQRCRNVPVLRERLVPNASIRLGSFCDQRRSSSWLGQRYFSADAQSDESQKKGLQESEIGQELLSEAKDQSSGSSDASQGL